MSENSAKSDIPVLKPGIDIAKPGDPQPEVDEHARKLYMDTLPSVVQIKTDKGFGSGWITDSSGRIGSAAHVVLGSREHFAITADGTKYKLEIEKLDDLNDTVILKPVKWKENSRPHLDLAPSKELKEDETITAMGHPGGLRPAYLSPGYFRKAETQLGMMKGLNEDAADTLTEKMKSLTPKEKPDVEKMINRDILNARIHIRPGDSGGPLLNDQGKVIGINDMITSFEMGYFVPSEKIAALQKDEGKFNFKYDWVANPIAQQYKSDWQFSPGKATAETLGIGTAAVVGNAVLNRFQTTGAIGIAGLGAMGLMSDGAELLNANDGRDQLKYGIASLGDLTAAAGAVATLVPRTRLLGRIAIGVGLAERAGAEFVPNRRVLTDISRKDGSLLPPISPDIEKSLGLGSLKGN